MTTYTDAVDARYRADLKRFERIVRDIERIRRQLEQRPVDYLALGFFNHPEGAVTPCKQT